MIDDDTLEDEILVDVLPRAALVMVGVLFFGLAFRLWSLALPGDAITAVVMLYIYGTAVMCIVGGGAGVDLERWGHWIGLWIVVVSLAGAAWIFLRRPAGFFGTDALLFPRLAAEDLLAGQSPYTRTYSSAEYPTAFEHATPTADGGYVHRLSYPLGSVLVLLPSTLLGSPGTMFMGVVAAGGLALIVLASPARLVPFGIVSYLGARQLVFAAAGGVTDALWFVPAMVALLLWADDRRVAAAAVLGIACSIKQTPWLILPYLGVWSLLEAGVARTARRVGAGVAVFAVINAPAIVATPRAWLVGVFGPLGSHAPLVQQGMGLTWLSVSGVYELPSTFFHATVALVGVVTLIGYAGVARRSGRARWAAWALPALLLFVHYRSLASYFTAFGVLAYLAALASAGALRRPNWPDVDIILEGIARD